MGWDRRRLAAIVSAARCGGLFPSHGSGRKRHPGEPEAPPAGTHRPEDRGVEIVSFD
jgi:hypothetical protein